MIGAIMSANLRSYPCLGLSAETKRSLRTRKKNVVGMKKQQQQKIRKFIVNELGGQYEEVFNDVKLELRNWFTAKAVRTVLYQLYEMNPPQYMWLHNFIAENDPADGKLFLRTLAKESQDIAERVMITRLHLYGKWIKQCDHAEIYKEISDENLELMRERLLETIVWPTDDKITE
ncbi:chaperonin-like RbcX protein 2, chloroplastic isoform X2 [Cynara cardunculus var. scolymus]|uniref:chaperonin-like RbcX protein 2, chloroplastic isoform X2 n=1 Tax=Cynara cardunculus var. scolymus TaxID=59895 RepID=UPI000D62963B|nr:chaperonin-like RbcX protein 2, chloroplastic isoform X2 [Cynara cardunculus var. scolymus]